MAYLHITQMKRTPKDATKQERQQLYSEYRLELMKNNPSHFDADGNFINKSKIFVVYFSAVILIASLIFILL